MVLLDKQKKIDKEKEFSRKFEKQIKEILSSTLIQQAPDHIDWTEAADLTLMRLYPYDIGVRVRRHKYLDDYGDEITIRYKRTSKKKTEWDKIIEGKADIYFYGFADEDEEDVVAYNILDLAAFRAQLCRQSVDYTVIERPPGKADFAAINTDSLNTATLIKRVGFDD